MNRTETFMVGLAVTVIGGIVVALFSNSIFGEPVEPISVEPISVEPISVEPISVDPISVDPISVEPAKPIVSVFELELKYVSLGRQRQVVLEHLESSRGIVTLIAYRLNSADISQPTEIEVTPFGPELITAQYYYQITDDDGSFDEKTRLVLYPNEYLTILTYWGGSQNNSPRLSFESHNTLFERSVISCSFHPGLNPRLCP
ncbi:MAG: hypothetical protein WBD31_06315 [Rubripirellula sp.]